MSEPLYSKDDFLRISSKRDEKTEYYEEYRSPFRRDYARLVHSPAFRRLQGKIQLFPNADHDFFRTRITHSIEVAQVAKSIALKLNACHDYFKNKSDYYAIDTNLVETAALAHDLGHPPFGHTGEMALEKSMREFGGFEGNAQTFRILSKLEKKALKTGEIRGINNNGQDVRLGLDLTCRTMAAVLKYDEEIPTPSRGDDSHPLAKGYYSTEKEIVNFIKSKVLNNKIYNDKFSTIECQIMDIADDIAYSTYDLEDAFKAKFLSPLKMICSPERVREAVGTNTKKALKKRGFDFDGTPDQVLSVVIEIFKSFGIFDLDGLDTSDLTDPYIVAKITRRIHDTSDNISEIGYGRTSFTSNLVGKFINGISVSINEEIPAMSKLEIDEKTLQQIEVLKHFTYIELIESPRLKLQEYRGIEIVECIFDSLTKKNTNAICSLLPKDFQILLEHAQEESLKMRIICDYIAGMTDQYAVEFYSRLSSENARSIFRLM